MSIQRLLFFVSILLSILFTAPVYAAGDHSRAKKLGKPDLSLLCPPGSKWSSKDGGTCRGCRGGKTPKLGKCPRTVPGSTNLAGYSHRRGKLSLVCRVGTFRKPKSRECWACPKHYVRNPLVKFNRPGICVKPPSIALDNPSVVARVPLKTALNPKKIVTGLQTMGCNRFGKSAVLSPIDGGSCWKCPTSHPTRTLNVVNSAKACITNKCGGKGQRACYLWEGRACKKGLAHNPFKNKCVAKKNIACKPLVSALRASRNAVIKANQTANGLKGAVLEKIPGMKFLLGQADNMSSVLEKQVTGLMAKVPTEPLLKDIDKIFENPEKARAISAIMAALDRNEGRILDLILNPDIACDPASTILQDLMTKIIEEAALGQDRADASSHNGRLTLAGLGFVSAANATTPAPPELTRELFYKAFHGSGFALTGTVAINVKAGPVKVPVVFGLSLAVQIFRDQKVRAALDFVSGINNPGKAKIGEFGSATSFGVFLAPAHKPCPPVSGWIEGFNAVGFGMNCAGLSTVTARLGTAKIQKMMAEFFTPDGLKGLAREKDLLRGGFKVTSGAAKAWTPNLVIGGRGGIRLIGQRTARP